MDIQLPGMNGIEALKVLRAESGDGGDTGDRGHRIGDAAGPQPDHAAPDSTATSGSRSISRSSWKRCKSHAGARRAA